MWLGIQVPGKTYKKAIHIFKNVDVKKMQKNLNERFMVNVLKFGMLYIGLRKPWRDICTYYLSLITYYLSLITYYLLLITYYLLLITYHISSSSSSSCSSSSSSSSVVVVVAVVVYTHTNF